MIFKLNGEIYSTVCRNWIIKWKTCYIEQTLKWWMFDDKNSLSSINCNDSSRERSPQMFVRWNSLLFSAFQKILCN